MPKKILVADDVGEMTSMIRSRLEYKGFEVDECWDGGDALNRILNNSYDLVLLDFAMPIMKGDNICMEIRKEPRLKDLPIIIMTGYSDREVEFFKAQGATEVIYKPINNEELMEKITSILKIS